MTDTPTPGAAPAAPDTAALPIRVNANPTVDQAAAALRVGLLSLGVIATAFGLAKATGTLTLLASLAGPIVTVMGSAVALGAFVVGQLKTRALSQKAAAMADKLDDKIAVAE